jgi:hypothetical protein
MLNRNTLITAAVVVTAILVYMMWKKSKTANGAATTPAATA